jgi:hypothetical protein
MDEARRRATLVRGVSPLSPIRPMAVHEVLAFVVSRPIDCATTRTRCLYASTSPQPRMTRCQTPIRQRQRLGRRSARIHFRSSAPGTTRRGRHVWLPYYPIWSLVYVGLSVRVVYALLAHFEPTPTRTPPTTLLPGRDSEPGSFGQATQTS